VPRPLTLGLGLWSLDVAVSWADAGRAEFVLRQRWVEDKNAEFVHRFLLAATADDDIDLDKAVGSSFFRVGLPEAIAIEVAEVTGISAKGHAVGFTQELRGDHSGIHWNMPEGLRIAKGLRNQSENSEDGHEEDAASDHDFDEREGGAANSKAGANRVKMFAPLAHWSLTRHRARHGRAPVR